ncbi:4493_t:CDS:2 [Entrophospora sp. SA101]|nr:12664_t:CDS:2 [Entrophospora sp. SA101]CAJ0632256.1 16319_t:CDS:2 [Entrophospora sp. SA101]CAJ0750139.1 23667_t:CDS:2 [Entrophospora sp. SA101]CAJ0751717.1 15657_t:CDS:2 [Entrophospora sp. SA101]CAJ0762626.1 4493_t:CDS:2 [Entrophospora sp. SA101]
MSKKNRNYRKKTKSEEEEETLAQIDETLDDLEELRKFRKKPQGIDVEKLLKDSNDNNKDEEEDDETVAKKKIMLDSFTKQTNTLDEEMRKRKGQKDKSNQEEDKEQNGPADPRDELFQPPDHLRIESKPISEGNVQLSTTMLTAIPEVDLGIDVRLKNIEETEKAKRKLLEKRHQKPKVEKDSFEGSSFSATNRFYRTRPTVSDHERINNGGDQSNHNSSNNNKHGARREIATDDIVAERFKKRLRR